MYQKLIKPILFLFPPDFVHNSIVVLGRMVQCVPLVRSLFRRWWRFESGKLEQNLFGITFRNPVGLSAGFDKNIELTPLMSAVGFGFETGGSVTLQPRKGNSRPWFHRLPKTESIVVHAGLANKGIHTIEKSIQRNQSRVKDLPLVISVAVVVKTTKESCHDAIIDAKNTTLYIEQHKLAQMIEINISCPNAHDDQPFSQPEMLERLLEELDTIDRSVPFFVKMPNLKSITKFDALLRVIVKHNIQGVTIANLIKDRSHVELHDHLPEDIPGGLSGTPTRDRSTALIRHTYERYGDRLKIIGVGGIFTPEHAYEKIRAGASLVDILTGVIFNGPQVVGRINRRLIELLEHDGFRSVTEAVGADHTVPEKKSKNL